MAFLPLAWHSFILMEFRYWSDPIGWLTMAAVLSGSVAAVALLFDWPARARRVPGEIVSVTRYPGLRVFECLVRVGEGWHGHQPGACTASSLICGERPQ